MSKEYYLELMVNNEYRENFECDGEKADEKYGLLPPAFTKQYLSWMPVGTSWHQVILRATSFFLGFGENLIRFCGTE